MPTDQSVFQSTEEIKEGGASTTTPPNESVPNGSVFNDQLASIKNEHGGQKYDDIPKALEGLRNAQEYIPQLQSKLDEQDSELARLREAVSKQEAVEDVVARLKGEQEEANTTAQSLSPEEVSAIVERTLTSRESASAATNNVNSVQEALVSQFGSTEAANKAVIEKAKELGTSPEDIGKLSSNNPKMVLALFSNVQSAPNGAPANSSINSDGFVTQAQQNAELKRPEKSLLAGSTSKELKEFMQQVKADVYKKNNVET